MDTSGGPDATCPDAISPDAISRDALSPDAASRDAADRALPGGGASAPGRGTLVAEASELDAGDELRAKREEFVVDDGTVYLDGNSLGALPRSVSARLAEVVEHEWGRQRIASWSEMGWWEAPERIGDRIAPLVGAGEGQIVVGDSTSVNLFKAVVGAVRLARRDAPGRCEVLVDEATFPTDGYIAASAARMTGCRVRPVAAARVAEEVGEGTAVALLNHVDYRTGELNDLPGATAAVREAGARTVWDLCHSAGALPVELDAHGVDFAAGCTYKYLNGGPGAPGYLYVSRALQPRFDSPLPGWNSHAEPFAMEPSYRPADGAARGRVGTPDILSMLALESALTVWDGVSLDAVRAKSLALSDFFLRCVERYVPRGRLRSLTPTAHQCRGSQVSLLCQPESEAEGLLEALTARGVIVDFRRPGVLRFGLTPLYTAFADVECAARTLGEVAK